jgi:hypothetical protein
MKGFTLIETILYLALLSMIMGGVILCVYQISDNAQFVQAGILSEEEGNFLLKKISWALHDAALIRTPIPNASGSVLSLDKQDFEENPITFELHDGNLLVRKGSGLPIVLNNKRVTVSNFFVEHVRIGIQPQDTVSISFVLNGKQFATTTEYLKIHYE